MKKNIVIATVFASLCSFGLHAQDAGGTGALSAYKDRYVQPTSAVSTQPAAPQAPVSTTGAQEVVTEATPPSTTAAQPATVTQTPPSTTAPKPVAKTGRFGFFF